LQSVPQVGVFDTVFHHTIPAKAYIYGLPIALYKKLGIRRYGFHGTSHNYVAHQAAALLQKPLEKLKLITSHLGNGSSITAISKGKSVDTSMGFTPLEGLVMGTRCGDIDPALVSYIMEREDLNTRQIDNLMNKSSGMLGLSETTNDMREIEAEAERGSEQHQTALEIYSYRIRKYIGAYLAVLNGADAIVFTGGIGENSSLVRQMVLSNLSFLGIALDNKKNENNEKTISKGKVHILVIPTNEELAIARDTKRILASIVQEIEKPVAEELIREELATISPDDKAELLLLWAENPRITLYELTNKLNKKLDNPISIQAVKRELEILELDKISEEKKEAMLVRSK
jgi:acetate kinase